jgi:hypothetical protein
MVGAAAAGALLAVVAFVAKLSRRAADRTVDRLYYASYACAGFSAVLFVMRGLFGASR